MIPVIWVKWNENHGISNKYYIDEIVDSDNLIIQLSDDRGSQIKLIWDGVVESYMCTEEINRTKNYSINELTSWTFFEVLNSRYLNWLYDESNCIIEKKKLHHFCLIGINSVVDIISSEFPQII